METDKKTPTNIIRSYQRYLKQQEEKEEKEAQQFDPTKGMPLNYEE